MAPKSKSLSAKKIGLVILIVGVGFGAVIGFPLISSIQFIAPNDQFEIPFNDPIPIGLPPINPDASICNESSTSDNCTTDMIPVPNGDNNGISVVCTEDIPPQCNDEIPPITSKDPPPVQICDELDCSDLPPIQIQVCPPVCGTSTLNFISLITKTSTDGEVSFSTERINLPLASFFAEETTNIDYSKGFLEIRTKLLSNNPDFRISGNALFDILINNKSALSAPINFQVNGQPCGLDCAVPTIQCVDEACQFGIDVLSVGASFVSPSGIKSPSFVFSIEDNLDKFDILQGTNVIKFVLLDVDFEVSVDSFTSDEIILFTMDITRDPNLILITDEEGVISRVFPTDDKFAYHNLGKFSLKSGGGCGSYWTRSSGLIEIFNAEDVLLKSGILKIGNTYGSDCGRNWNVMTLNLQRDTEYRLVHSGDTFASNANFDITFKTPKSQKNYSLQCYFGGIEPLAYHYCQYPSPDGTEIIRAPLP